MKQVFRLACVAFALGSATPWLIAQQAAGTRGALYIGLQFVLTALMVIAYASAVAGEASFQWLLATGLLARVVAGCAPPFTSNDVYRYLWDGHVVLSGGDPWRTTPASWPSSGWPLPPDNLEIASLYPPAAMLLFALVAKAGPVAGLWVWKGLTVLAGELLLLVLALPLRGTAGVRWLPLVALSPLLVMEAGVGAHLDILTALTVAAAMLSLRRGGVGSTGLLLGLGGLIKLLPLVALVPIAAALGCRTASRVALAAAATLGLGYGVAFAAGLVPVGSLGVFLGHWRFGSIVGLLPVEAAALVAAGLFVSLMGWSVVRARRGGADAGLPQALAAPLLASPVVFPWYLLPLATTTIEAPSAFVLVWAALAPLTYEVIDAYRLTGGFHPAAWPVVVTGVALLAALVFDVRRLPGERSAS